MKPTSDEPADGPELWTVKDVAKYLQLKSTRTVQGLQKSHGLPAHKITATMVRYVPAEIEAWARSRCGESTPGEAA